MQLYTAADSPDDLAPMLSDSHTDKKVNHHVFADRLLVDGGKARKVAAETTLFTKQQAGVTNGTQGKMKKLGTIVTPTRKRENLHERAESPLETEGDDEFVSPRRSSPLPSNKRPRRDDDDNDADRDAKKKPARQILTDFIDDVNVIPLATLQEYDVTPENRGYLRSHGPKCVCKITTTARNRDFGECRSNATVCGRPYCHYAVDEAVHKWWLTGEFNTNRLVRLLMNMVFTMGELCCMTTVSKSGKFVEIPEEHLLDLQQAASGHFDKFIQEAADDDSGRPPPSSEFLEQQQQLLLSLKKLKAVVRKFLSDTRCKWHCYVSNKSRRHDKKSAKKEE